MILKKTGEIERQFMFDFTELTAIAEYLEKQEEKGLRLKEIRSRKFIFEKCEPGKIRYTADIYKGSFVKDFTDSCKREGWEFVATYDYLYIFRTEKEDAIDIVTDDEDKYKAVRARAFLNPKYYGFYIMIIYYLFRFMFYLLRDRNTILEDSYYTAGWWSSILSLALFAGSFAFCLLDIFPWLHDAKSALKRGEKVKYHNFDDVIKKQNSMVIILGIFVTLIILITSFIDSGYAAARSFYWSALFVFIIVCPTFTNFAAFRAQDKSTKRKQLISFLIIFAVLFVEPFVAVAYNERKAPAEYEKAPITFEDFGFNEKDIIFENKSVGGTRFYQRYVFEMELDKVLDTGENYSIEYEIFVSDYPNFTQKYINYILATYKIVDILIMDVDDSQTDWDKQYKEYFLGEATEHGYAIKDNTVVLLEKCWGVDGQDFFEVAYEKLFGEDESKEEVLS